MDGQYRTGFLVEREGIGAQDSIGDQRHESLENLRTKDVVALELAVAALMSRYVSWFSFQSLRRVSGTSSNRPDLAMVTVS